MKNIKVERAVYAAWDYELEIEHLNQMSEQGWQLIQGGCFHTKYERDNSVVYRYQLDHNMRIENRVRYADAFREQGWEYINSTFNGWHYFRKVYSPDKPAEEYEIYSDRPSRREMAGRLSKVMLGLAAVMALLLALCAAAFIDAPKMGLIGILVEMLAALTLTATGFVRMRAVGKGEKPRSRFRVEALIAVMLLGLVWMMVFSSAGLSIMMNSSAGMVETSIDVRLPDWFSIKAECGENAAMSIELSDESGELLIGQGKAVTEGENTSVRFEKSGIFLLPGTYSLSVQCEPETALEVELD